MLGHGSPLRWQRLQLFGKPLSCLATRLSALRICILVLLLCIGSLDPPVAKGQVAPPSQVPASVLPHKLTDVAALPIADTPSVEPWVGLRISWGGGTAARWKCRIESSSGPVRDLTPLGLASDTPGSMYLDKGIALVDQPSAGVYNGIELYVENQPTSEITITVVDADQPAIQFQKTIPLTELLTGPIGLPIDTRQNRLNIARTPGDALKVNIEREHLVFWQGDEFTVGVQPHLTGIVDRKARCKATLVRARNEGPSIWSRELEFDLDSTGSAALQQLSFEMPEEGVYDLVLQLEPRGGVPLRTPNPVVRKLQFVSLSKQAPTSSGELWREQALIDPTSSRTLAGFQWAKLLKNAGLKQGTSSHSKRNVVNFENQRMVELGPGGWQAIGLRGNRSGEPLLIEVEYVAEEDIQMGLSVLQPHRHGELPEYGFDTGVVVPKSFGSTENSQSKLRRHQVVFWPETSQPYLVVSNRGKEMPLKFGKIRILSGPNRLAVDNHVPDPDLRDRTRQFLSFYDSPMFPENFGAEEVLDLANGQRLDDWKTFYDGADRLIQHLKANGYSGTILTVAADSGTIYPSKILEPTPIFDSGRFFATGQDPIPKDVLEMLCRMFNREGLTLIPGLSLSGPIPNLENQIRAQGGKGLRPVDFRGDPAPASTEVPVYSALHADVQQAVVEVVDEVTTRYSHHNCFKGVSLICRPKTYTQLGGRRWGYDSPTVTRFLDDSGGVQLVAGVANDWTQVQNWLLGSNHKQWFDWRAKQVGSWYNRLQRTVSKDDPRRRLYLAPIDIYRHPDIVSSLSPSLHWSNQFEEAMLEMGWAPELWPENPSVVMFKPQRIDHNAPLAANKIEYQTRQSKKESEFYQSQTITGELFLHQTFWSEFLEREQAQWPGEQPETMLRLQQLTPSHWHNRKRFIESLRDLDSRLMVDGGWLIAQGQETALVDLIDVYTQLPDIPFDTLSSRNPEMNSGPIVVRQAIADGRWYFYCLNDSPWEVKTRVQFNRIDVGKLESLSLSELEVLNETVEGEERQFIELTMQPFSVVGGYSTEPAAQMNDFSFVVDPSAGETMRKRLNQLQLRLIQAAKVKPTDGITNPEFEFTSADSLPGWTFDKDKTDKFSLQKEEDNAALLMRAEAESNWIRSNPFPVPATGRLSVSVWLRTDKVQEQPPLRIAVESDQGNYYRFGTIGSLAPNDPVNQVGPNWRQYVVHFDDLPLDNSKQLRVGFDMIGKGEVWIDRVETYDRLFDSNDIQALTQLLGTARPLVENQTDYDTCRRILNRYWLRFLYENIGQGTLPEPVEPVLGEIIFNQQPAARTSSILERFRKMVPRRRRR